MENEFEVALLGQYGNGERSADELGEERGTDEGAMPAKVSLNMRPMVMTGLAKLVEL